MIFCDREQYFCFLHLITPVNSKGLLFWIHTSLYDKRDDVNFHVTKRPFLSSNISFDFFFYFMPTLPHDLIEERVLSLVKWCFNRESKRTSLLQTRRDFSPTRNMTRIHVGLALTYLKLLLFSWKIYVWNVIAWYTNTNSGHSYEHLLFSTYSRLISKLLREGFYVKPPEILTVWPHWQVQRYISIS